MSLRSITKTRWTVEADRITIYPFGIAYILAAVLAVIFAGLAFVYVRYENTGIEGSMPLLLLLLLILLLFWSFGNTVIEFDNQQGIMRKKLMGFIPVQVVPFDRLYQVNAITNVGGGYNYRMFKKDDKYGKGITLSSGYSRNDDPNAIAFVEEAVPRIHDFLNQHDAPELSAPARLDSYKYFTQHGNGQQYVIKKNKVLIVIIGLLLLAFGIHEFSPAAWITDLNLLGKVLFFLFFIVGGPLVIITGFTTVTFDQETRTISRKSPIGIGSRTWNFADFTGVQTVRRSVNFIYSGTDVQMHFQRPEANKPDAIVVNSFRRSRSIERFIQELYQIMGIS